MSFINTKKRNSMQKQILVTIALSSAFSYGMETEQKTDLISATELAITRKKNTPLEPICTFSFEQETPIVQTITYALKNESIKRILILDEHAVEKTNKILALHFKDKIIIHNPQDPETLWNSLYKSDYNPKLNNGDINIDLALYSISMANNSNDKRQQILTTLLHHMVPTVCIFSDNICKRMALYKQIENIHHKYTEIFNLLEPREGNLSNSSSLPSDEINPELTSSIISMKLKVAQRHLKKRLNINNSAVLDGSLVLNETESSSNDHYGDDEASSSSNNYNAYESSSIYESSNNDEL